MIRIAHFTNKELSSSKAPLVVVVLLLFLEEAEIDHQRGSQQQRLLLPGRARREVRDEVIGVTEELLHARRPDLLDRAHFIVIHVENLKHHSLARSTRPVTKQAALAARA